MIDKLGLDGLGGASVRVEPTPQEPLGDSEGTATPAVVGLEPVAFMTHHDDPMLFPTWDEAVQYCDDDESPISLFHAADVAKLQAQLAAMTQERDWLDHKSKCLEMERASQERYLTECQAREQQLREALKAIQHGFATTHQVNAVVVHALSLPQDDTALNTLLAAGQVREQQLREALDICKREMQGDKWDALYIDGVLANK